MRVLFIGDIMGQAGRRLIKTELALLKKSKNIDFVVANGENMAGGSGISPGTYDEVMRCGIDVMTGGNHSFDKKEGHPLLKEKTELLRPDNYPSELPGRGHVVHTNKEGFKLGVINLIGRTFMEAVDCPFRRADELLKQMSSQTPCILVDFHAEATSEKMAMGWHLDGRVSCVVGTHTHCPTSDERILEKGTAFQTDAGMTGPYDSVLGIKKEIILERFLIRKGRRFEVANGSPWLCGLIVEIDTITGNAQSVERVQLRKEES